MKKRTLITQAAIFAAFFILIALMSLGCQKSLEPEPQVDARPTSQIAEKSTLPSFPMPEDFVSEITNPYLGFADGRIFTYEGETDEGLETIVVEVTRKHKTILGVRTTVVHEQAFLDGELIEDTFDWFAQDKDGNVWYFGEDSKEIEDGEVVSTEGSWEAGVDGAQPGIIMLAQPEVGLSYRQEFYEGVAEDMAKILSLDETVSIGLGNFTGNLETLEWTPLEPGARENKFYQPGIGLILIEDHKARTELVSIEN